MLQRDALRSGACVGTSGAFGFGAVRCGPRVVGAQAFGWKTAFNADIGSWNTARVVDMFSVCALWTSRARAFVFACVYACVCMCVFSRVSTPRFTSTPRRRRPSRRRLAGVLRCEGLQRGHQQMEHCISVKHGHGMCRFRPTRAHRGRRAWSVFDAARPIAQQHRRCLRACVQILKGRRLRGCPRVYV